eukprot:g16026.t1
MKALSIDDVEVEDPKPTFCVAVGWPGVALYALALAVAGAHLYIAAEFTFYFQDMQREYVWVFLILAVVSVLLVIYHMFMWQTITEDKETSDRTTCIQRAKAFKAHFDMNGKWFLCYLYGSEVLESGMQVYNMATLYTCTLPPGIVLVLCLVLVLDHGYRLHSLWQPNTVQRRDAQVIADLCTDLLCMVLPIAFMWFGYLIPLTMVEMLLVVFVPTVFTLLKLDELMEENVLRRSAIKIVERQRKRSMNAGRRRSSLFAKTSVEASAEAQALSIGKPIQYAMSVVTVVAGIIFLAAGIFAVSVSPSCDEELWQGCEVRVPLCQFRVSCNCAVLQIRKHNMTSLPPAIEAMTAMKKMQINHGPLKQLPELGDFMPGLSALNVDFNALTTLPASLARAPNLVFLYASFNRIAHVPEELFRHPTLYSIDLSTNNMTSLPQPQMPMVRQFYVVNNSLARLPNSIFDLPLVRLAVDGNQLTSISTDVGHLAPTLTLLTFSLNNVSSLPSSISTLTKLEVLDMRNNSLTFLPPWNELKSLVHLYVAGNPLCKFGWAGTGRVKALMETHGKGCTRQCSDSCLDILLENMYCNNDCNVPECDYDNGKCVL